MSENNIVKIPPSKIQQLKDWISKLIYPGDEKDFIITNQYGDASSDFTQSVMEFSFYTSEFKYKIYAIDRSTDDGYLGCQAIARKIRAGENWNRGNDLGDGPFNETTWQSILNRIINYELVQLSKYIKPADTPEDIA